jgi:GT2 family glycosyltransferase
VSDRGLDASGVTLVVLNYNGRELLPVILGSVDAQSARDFAVHVIDDGSTDDSLAYLAERWPQVTVLPSEVNIGVAGSLARAIATAETEYVGLLNNDLELDPGWLDAMLAALEQHPAAASADGKMLNFHRRDEIDGAGDLMGRNGYARRRGQGERDEGQYDEPGEVFSATGGGALYRRAAFELVGPFDRQLGAYYEDVDWGFRARLLGMTARYVPTAVSYHMGSATTGREPARYASQIVRNQLLVVIKDFPAPLLLRHLPRIVFFELKWLLFDALHGLGRAHLRGLVAAIAMLPRALASRRAVQRARTASVRELERALS